MLVTGAAPSTHQSRYLPSLAPPGCLCCCCCLLTARFHSPVSQSVGDRQQAGAEEPHHITLVSLSPATSTGLRPTPTPTTREARRPPWRIGCSRPTSQPAEPRWRPVVVSYVVGLLTNSLTVGQAGGRGREIARSIVALPLGFSIPGWDGWTTSFYRYFIYLLTAYDRSSNFFLGVARSEAMVLVPGQWASSGAEGRGGHARLVGRTFISEMRHGENGFSTGRTCPLLLFVQGEAAWVGALLVGWASR